MFQNPFQNGEEVDGGGGRVCVASPCPLHTCPDLPDIRVSIAQTNGQSYLQYFTFQGRGGLY